ncbi:MAG: glycosyltransferase family 2 protein [Pseudomonadota bacterium]
MSAWGPFDGLRVAGLYAGLHRKDRRAGRQLRPVQDRTAEIGPGTIPLVACLRNEAFRMEAFVAHYRRLGVGHFLFVDNDSDDGFMDWASAQKDVSVWHTAASYKASNFGMLWCNDLLRRYGAERWCVCVDPDEFLVYPYMQTRSLRALAQHLDDAKRRAFPALMLDAYSDRPLAQATLAPGQDPFEVCPFFDRDGYIQSPGWGSGLAIRGGPRMRVHFRDRPWQAPALNKIPFVKWRRTYHYRSSMHDAWPFELNRAEAKLGQLRMPPTTGALFHFKFVASLKDKAAEEMARGEHYAGSREYARYHADAAGEFFADGISTRYEGPQQLVDLGLMSPGRWF